MFEIGSAINSLADSIINAPFIDRISRNPIYTSLVITFILILIVMFTFRDVYTDSEDESLLSTSLQMGFYVFLIITGIVFMHDRILMKEQDSAKNTSQIAQAFNITAAGEKSNILTESDIVPIKVDIPGAQIK
jgi:hypothetical protein